VGDAGQRQELDDGLLCGAARARPKLTYPVNASKLVRMAFARTIFPTVLTVAIVAYGLDCSPTATAETAMQCCKSMVHAASPSGSKLLQDNADDTCRYRTTNGCECVLRTCRFRSSTSAQRILLRHRLRPTHRRPVTRPTRFGFTYTPASSHLARPPVGFRLTHTCAPTTFSLEEEF